MNNSSDEPVSESSVSPITSRETAENSAVYEAAINQLSLVLARFSFKDSLDLEVCGTDTSTSRIEADEEDNLDINEQQLNNKTEQHKKTVASCSTPVATHQNLPKSKLRSGKIFRISKSSESLLDCRNKIVIKENKKQNLENNSNIQKGKEMNTQSHNSQNTQSQDKMVDIGKINALVYNNIPMLTGENSETLKSEVIEFIRCIEHVEPCISKNEEEIFLDLIGSRIRFKAADALKGIEISTTNDLKKLLKEKLLKNKPYYLLRSELQSLYQFSGESVESFGNRVLRVLTECKEAITVIDNQIALKAIHQELEEHALHIFKSGIKNINLRWFCLADTESNFKTLLEKVAKLEILESQINYNNRFGTNNFNFPQTNYLNTNQITSNKVQASLFNNNPQIFSPNSAPFTHNFPQSNYPQSPINDYQTQFTENLSRGNSNNMSKLDKRFVKCNFCGKNGHYFSDCRLRKNTPFCNTCKLYGHTPQYCREKIKPPYNDQKQVQAINRNKNKNYNKQINETICDFCKRRNHKVNDCKFKIEWENKKSAQPSGN